MILLSFCRDMAVLARGKTRGLLLQCLHGGTITNLLQNDNDKFLVPKQSFGLEMYIFFFKMLMINKSRNPSTELSSPCRLYD